MFWLYLSRGDSLTWHHARKSFKRRFREDLTITEKALTTLWNEFEKHHFAKSFVFERDYELPKLVHHITTIEPYQFERIPINTILLNNTY